MSVWGALAGGAVGSFVLVIGYRLAQELGLTRMDIPFLLGTLFTENRSRANLLGYSLHFGIGLVVALLYAAVFAATGEASWWFGLALGTVQAGFVGGGLANVLLPAIHPRMGTPWSDSKDTPLLEPPGFLLFNYGRSTLLITLLLNAVYGTIVGAFAAGI